MIMAKSLLRNINLNSPAIVDRVQVTIYTDAAKVSEMHQEAKAIYKRRDERLKEMKDEKVDTFYSCLLWPVFRSQPCLHLDSRTCWPLRCCFLVGCESCL